MKKNLLYVMFSLLIAFGAKAQEEITIVNPSFELPDGGLKITNPNEMDGWLNDAPDTDSGREASATAPDGAMIGYARNSDGRIYQQVDILTANKTEYVFTMQAMITWNPNPLGYCNTYFSVLDEGDDYVNRVVVDELSTEINAAGFIEISHTYLFDAGHEYEGKVLIIEYAFVTDGAQDGWAGFDDLHLTRDLSTSVKELNDAKLLSVSPNPASESCTISVNSTEVAQYAIYNISGKEVKSGSFSNSCILDLSDLNNGMYLVKVNSKNKSEVAKLIVR
jgi:hypothetical protein